MSEPDTEGQSKWQPVMLYLRGGRLETAFIEVQNSV